MIVTECFDFGARIQINENDAPGCCVFNISGFSFISLSVVMDTNFAYIPLLANYPHIHCKGGRLRGQISVVLAMHFNMERFY